MHPYKLTNLLIHFSSKKIKKKAKEKNKIIKQNFIEKIKNKKIDDRWFLNNFEVFNYFLPVDKDRNFSYLEIGCYEGLSALNVLIFYKNVNATLVDIWEDPNFNSTSLSSNFKKIEDNFDFNMSNFKNFKKIKNDSLVAIRNLIRKKEKFDYIYIDGSHNGEDVISDAVESFKILNQEGIMIFDDAACSYKSNLKYQTFEGIYYFLKMFKKEIKILYFQNILVIKKI